MNDDKLSWILAHGRCPRCAATPLVAAPDRAARCPGCGATFPFRAGNDAGGAVDFVDDATRAQFEIVDTENVSDHPFDGNALVIIERCADAGGYVLDCGSGYKSASLPNVVQMEIVAYPHVDVLAVNQSLPFADDSFDAVFSLDVLEHVNDPFRSAAEIARVLKPGGYLYVDVPFMQAEHGYPNHFFNATRSGLLRLFSGLEPLSHHVPAPAQPIQVVHDLLHMYCHGLPEAEQAEFRRLTVAELVDRPAESWHPFGIVGRLDEQVVWAMPSTTQALLRKPAAGTPGPAVTSGVALAPGDLPGFPGPGRERVGGSASLFPAAPAAGSPAGPAPAARPGTPRRFAAARRLGRYLDAPGRRWARPVNVLARRAARHLPPRS